jgi:signal peptidase I
VSEIFPLERTGAGRQREFVNFRKKLVLLLICPAIVIVVAMLMLTGTVKVYHMPSQSMSPTIQPGDWLIATRLFKPAGNVSKGQLVVFDSRRANRRLSGRFIQRVVATQGDTVDLIDGRLHVNGQPLPDRNGKIPRGADSRAIDWPLPNYPLVIPQGQIFTLGDNYENSLDGRYFGPFPIDAVTHRPHRVILPLSRASKIE